MHTLPGKTLQAQWQTEFEKYRAIPQYRQVNGGMTLEAFKTIYWWEWTHRIIGRTIGLSFLLPLLWFLWRGWIPPGRRAPLWTIFGLGALLDDRPDGMRGNARHAPGLGSCRPR